MYHTMSRTKTAIPIEMGTSKALNTIVEIIASESSMTDELELGVGVDIFSDEKTLLPVTKQGPHREQDHRRRR